MKMEEEHKKELFKHIINDMGKHLEALLKEEAELYKQLEKCKRDILYKKEEIKNYNEGLKKIGG